MRRNRESERYGCVLRCYQSLRLGKKRRGESRLTWRLKADIASSEPTSRDFARAILGRWKLDRDDDVRYADERSWVKDIFKAETTCWTEERDRYPGFAPRRSKPVRNEELQAGDTTELDSFLASFNK